IAKVKRVKPILLIDDVGAELDINSRSSLSKAIDKLDCQVIITAIDVDVLQPFLSEHRNESYYVFHVKHGKVSELNNSEMNSIKSK
ncbi:MAG: DNA replication and repair protein RecF, partial [Colwellia sp.]